MTQQYIKLNTGAKEIQQVNPGFAKFMILIALFKKFLGKQLIASVEVSDMASCISKEPSMRAKQLMCLTTPESMTKFNPVKCIWAAYAVHLRGDHSVF